LVLPDGSRVVVTELSTNVIALLADLGRRPAVTRRRPRACLARVFGLLRPSRSRSQATMSTSTTFPQRKLSAEIV